MLPSSAGKTSSDEEVAIARFKYRQVPTTALPDPPVMAIFRDRGTPEVGAAVNFAVAIMFMAPDGTMQVGTN